MLWTGLPIRRIKNAIACSGLLLIHFHVFAQQTESRPIISDDFRAPGQNTDDRYFLLSRDTSRVHRLADQAEKMRMQNTDSAILIFQEILRQSFLTGYYDGMAIGLMGIGICHTDQGYYDRAIHFISRSWSYCVNARFFRDELISLYYNNMAVPYSHQGKYEQAMSYYYKALHALKDQHGDTSRKLALLLNNIGATWLASKQYDKALEHLEEGTEAALRTNREDLLSSIYLNIAACYGETDDWAKFDHYIRKALMWSLKTGNAEMQKRILTNAGTSLSDRGMPEKAIVYLEQARSYGLQDPYYAQLVPYKNIGIAFYRMQKYPEAERYLLQALELALQLGISDNLLGDIYTGLTDVYTAQARHDKALDYQKAYSQLRDSVYRTERQAMVNQLEARYRTAQKDKTIARNNLLISRQNAAIKTGRIWMGSIVCGVLLASCFLFVLYRNRQRLQVEKIRNLQQEQELAELKAQIKGEEKERVRLARDLHDGMVGQLAAIKMNFGMMAEILPGLGARPEFRKVLQQLDDAAKELRKTSHNLMPDIILQEGLLEAVRSFCVKTASTSGLQISIHLSGSLPELIVDFELAVYRIIQELVQNMLKHAGATQALVQINCHDPVFIVTVEDNGHGFSPEKFEHGSGMGLKNIRARVKTFDGAVYMNPVSETGTSISIEFDITHLKKTIPYVGKSSDY